MRNNINIKGVDQTFKYLIDYTKDANTNIGHNTINGSDIKWYNDNNVIRIIKKDIEYFRNGNDWYNIKRLTLPECDNYIPEKVNITNIKLYIPTHSLNTYMNGIKYVITVNTWINGIKIDLGSFIFEQLDTYAIPTGVIKDGNNEYYEYISFDIIDPFYLIYSDAWDDFRKSICNESANTNNTGTNINISLFAVNEYDNSYILLDNVSGGYTNFNIVNNSDFLELKAEIIKDPSLGIKYNIQFNTMYDSFIEYLDETYGIKEGKIVIDTVLKSKTGIIADTIRNDFTPITKNYGNISQLLLWNNVIDTNLIKLWFEDWDNFEEGWNIVGSVIVYIGDDEVFSIVSNEIPVTQELFSIFTAGGCEKIIDIEEMKVTTYNVVNKIENNIIQIERANESKSNIIQPVFFRAKDTEVLTLHPIVTENVSINLDDYKSKVKRFTLKIGDLTFDQIGANNYGIIFKITANTIPAHVLNGTYYILNEQNELVTTGKYNCIR